jgi:hypothetical protein
VLSLGALAFLNPWMLSALGLLPIIWWLVRVTPPPPRLVRFPALRLLLDLPKREKTPARTPWWLLLLRLVVAALVILALAAPLLNPSARLVGSGPLVLVIDDGWTSAARWRLRSEALGALIDQAERAGRPVVLIGTAAPATGGPHVASRLLRAGEARALAQGWRPKSWNADRAGALAAIEAIEIPRPAEAIWLSDGLDDGGARALAEALQRFGSLQIVSEAPEDLARALSPPVADGTNFSVQVRRLPLGPAETGWIKALAEQGQVVARERFDFAAAQGEAKAEFRLPSELRNRIERLEIEGMASAGAVVLVDERWRRRPVGLVSGGTIESAQPLLSDIYYLSRALQPFAEVREGQIGDLMKRALSMIVLADVGQVVGADRAALDAWIDQGGVLVRFAGPRLAEANDSLVPTRLRGGGRALDGAMVWGQPARLAPYAADSPFFGLNVTADVTVRRQVLAEPALDLAKRTWAKLEDGTPLVTGERRGNGWLVLFHTTANTSWSNLALSGQFVEMLQRLSAMGRGIGGAERTASLRPVAVLDGFGRLGPPGAVVLPIRGDQIADTPIGPRHPPGFYGTEDARQALNATARLAPFRRLPAMPSGVGSAAYAAGSEIPLKPWLLAAAIALGILDLAISLGLRGLIFARAAGILALAALSWPESARAADDFAKSASLDTRLAYVRTQVRDVDQMSFAGLRGLTDILARRTSVEAGEPIEVDIEADDLMFFPLLYWPITPAQKELTPKALAKVDTYMKTGGTILFDTRDQGQISTNTQGVGPGTLRLRQLLAKLDLPPLVPVPPDHVLTKAFYLMQEFPGRFAGGSVWVERHAEGVNDGVSGIIVGGNDWAAAWAIDDRGQAIAALVPGGERQREMANRFGVNLVMYVLTGNYKADQVHVPAILERLGQ